MATSIGSATLTASWATIGTVSLQGSWAENRSGGAVTVRLKHTKHASQSGGYPMVRFRYKTHNVAGTLVTSLDPLVNSTITESGGVATLNCDTGEFKILALTDSDGTKEYDLVLQIPPYKEQLVLEAKQAGDTTNFGTLAAELDGKI